MKKKQYQKMNWAEIESIVYSDCSHPFQILGPHTMGKETLLQAFFPYAGSVKVCFDDGTGEELALEEVEEEGFFAVFFPNRKKLSYHYEVLTPSGEVKCVKDPYAFPVPLSDKEAMPFLRGVDDSADQLFAPRETELKSVKGVLFRVYAPNAVRVSVIGPFNRFDGRMNPMEKDDKTGIFTLFLPGIEAGAEYCYEIKKKSGDVLVRRDPYALSYGDSHLAACKVMAKDTFAWKDASWIAQRKQRKDPATNLSIYTLKAEDIPAGEGELFENSCKEMISQLLKLSCTHIKIVGLWESIGHKPYPVKGFLAVKESLLAASALKKFVNLCHKNNIGVLTELAIAYFGNDESGLAYFDGTHLYEHADARKGYHSYFDACLFQYRTPQVQSLLYTSLRFLLDEFHLDGFVWMDVASMLYLDYKKTAGEWICNEQGGNCNFEAVSLIREMNAYLETYDKGLLSVACIDAVWSQVTRLSGEESLGFDYVENHGITDALVSFVNADVYHKRNALYDVLRQAKYAFCEGFVLPDKWNDSDLLYAIEEAEEKAASRKLLDAVATFYPGKKMFAYSALETMNAEECNAFYAKTPLLYENDMNSDSLRFIETTDSPSSVLSFARIKEEDMLLVIANASGEALKDLRVAAPLPGKYKVVLAMNSQVPRGMNTTEETACNKLAQSFVCDLPAWGMKVFSYRAFTDKELAQIAERKRKQKIQMVKEERARIEKERDRIIAEAIRDASEQIQLLEKELKELEK